VVHQGPKNLQINIGCANLLLACRQLPGPIKETPTGVVGARGHPSVDLAATGFAHNAVCAIKGRIEHNSQKSLRDNEGGNRAVQHRPHTISQIFHSAGVGLHRNGLHRGFGDAGQQTL